jgi:hypothetical protein
VELYSPMIIRKSVTTRLRLRISEERNMEFRRNDGTGQAVLSVFLPWAETVCNSTAAPFHITVKRCLL